MSPDFRNVTPNSGSTGAAPYQPAPGAGSGSGERSWIARRWPLVAIAVAVVAVAVIVIASLGGGSDDSDSHSAIRTAHGPASITGGVPSGYTRDKDGAATAAVNFLQALDQADQGRIDANNVKSTMLAPNPGPKVTDAIASASNRAESADTLNTMPAAVNVSDYTQDAARVSVWTMSLSQSNLNDSGAKSITPIWSTTDVSLVWSGDDWKVQEQSFHSGPQPQDVSLPKNGDPLAGQLVGGYYSFYVN